jgi:FkbM family methyltransferase
MDQRSFETSGTAEASEKLRRPPMASPKPDRMLAFTPFQGFIRGMSVKRVGAWATNEMAMKIGNRDLRVIASAPFKLRHAIAAKNMLGVYCNPSDALYRYLLGKGDYPAGIKVKTPIGPILLTCNSPHDMLTVNEIFCRLDYLATDEDQVVVDFGSNIGISAAYFLTRSRTSFAYLYEPLQFNIDRLRTNLRAFEGRYSLNEVAVGLEEGKVQFGWEESGRYGGIGLQTGKYMSVNCIDANMALREVIARHGRIDILKIDIETLEKQVTERIPADVSCKIRKIYVEYRFEQNPLLQTHRYRQYGGVARLLNRLTTS